MAKIWHYIKLLKAEYQSIRYRSEFERNHDFAVKLEIVNEWLKREKIQSPLNAYYPMHPHFTSHIEKCKDKIRDLKMKIAVNPEQYQEGITISIGDSIVGFGEEELSDIIDLNLSLPGDSGLGFSRVMDSLQSDLSFFRIRMIVMGTFIGNGLLSYQNYEIALEEFRENWRRVRAILPDARIFAFGLPPSYNFYANSLRFDFNAKQLVSIARQDGNAVVSLFQKGYAGKFGIFPLVSIQTDGIHLTEKGFLRLGADITTAKLAFPGTIIS